MRSRDELLQDIQVKRWKKFRTRHVTGRLIISQKVFEELLNECDVSYEQAKQLQTIIENLQDIKQKAVLDALDKIRAEIEEYRDSMRWDSESLVKWEAINYVLEHIIDKYKGESEE